jgi:hypothetical protein
MSALFEFHNNTTGLAPYTSVNGAVTLLGVSGGKKVSSHPYNDLRKQWTTNPNPSKLGLARKFAVRFGLQPQFLQALKPVASVCLLRSGHKLIANDSRQKLSSSQAKSQRECE